MPSPRLSSRVLPSSWPSRMSAGLAGSGSEAPRHPSTRRLPVSATQNTPSTTAQPKGQYRLDRLGVPPALASTLSRSPCPSTHVGSAKLSSGMPSHARTRWCQASQTTRRPSMTVTPVGRYRPRRTSVPPAAGPSLRKSGWPSTTSASAPSASGIVRQMRTRWLPVSHAMTRCPSVQTPRGAYIVDGVGSADGSARPPGEAPPRRSTGWALEPPADHVDVPVAGRAASDSQVARPIETDRVVSFTPVGVRRRSCRGR